MSRSVPKTHCPQGHDIAVVGRDQNRRCKECRRDGPRAHTGNARLRPPEVEEQIRQAWEETPATATEIAGQFGLTKNAVIGMAARRQWISDKHPQRTMSQRLDALATMMDAIIAETQPVLDAKVKPTAPAGIVADRKIYPSSGKRI